MTTVDTIVIGGSAGGIESLTALVGFLPEDLRATLCVVNHFPEASTSVLPQILSRRGRLPAKHAEHGEETRLGVVYVAPPGFHLLVGKEHLRLARGPKENGSRPAIDPLFRSAAHARGGRIISLLTSGLLDDGTLGSWAVKRCGGTTLAQDPQEATYGDMPANAIRYGAIDHVDDLAGLAARIQSTVGTPVNNDMTSEPPPDPVEMSFQDLAGLESQGVPSIYVCPECQGTLFELSEDGVFHYRCRVGHSYLPETLNAHQESELEAALWVALRSVKEHNDLLRQMLERAERRGFDHSAKNYREKLSEGEQRLDFLRRAAGFSTRGDSTSLP